MATDFLRINGANVNTTLFGVTILWYALSIFGLLPVTIFQLHRLRQRFKTCGGSSPSKSVAAENRRHLKQWLHIAATVAFVCIIFDPELIFFDWSDYYRSFCLGQILVIMTNATIYYFVSHVEVFILAECHHLSTPAWLPVAKRWWLVLNMAIGNAILIVLLVAQRRFVSGLLQVFTTSHGLVLGPLLLIMMRRINKELETRASDSPLSMNAIKRARRFRWLTTISGVIMILLGVIFWAIYLPRFWEVDPSIRNTSQRRNLAQYRFTLPWIVFPVLAWMMKIWWIPPLMDDAQCSSKKPDGNASLRARSFSESQQTLRKALDRERRAELRRQGSSMSHFHLGDTQRTATLVRTLTELEARRKSPSSFDALSATTVASSDTAAGGTATARGSASTSACPYSADSTSSFPRSSASVSKFLSTTSGSSSSGSYTKHSTALKAAQLKFPRVPSFSHITGFIEDIPELATSSFGMDAPGDSSQLQSLSIGSDPSLQAKTSDVDSITNSGYTTSNDGSGGSGSSSARPSYSSVQSLSFGSHRSSLSSVPSVRRSSAFANKTNGGGGIISQPRRSVVDLATQYDRSSASSSRRASLFLPISPQGPVPLTQITTANGTGMPATSNQKEFSHRSSKSMLLVGHVSAKVEPIVLPRRQSQVAPLPGMVDSDTLTRWQSQIVTVPEMAVPVVPCLERGQIARSPAKLENATPKLRVSLTVQRTLTGSSVRPPDTPCQAARRASIYRDPRTDTQTTDIAASV